MGFMDKAKKLADQAQAKLDEVQQQFNQQQGGGAPEGGPAVEYDNHGRVIAKDPDPPHGDPLARPVPSEHETAGAPTGDPLAEAAPAPPAPADKSAALQPEPTDQGAPQGDPLAEAAAREPKTPPSGGNPGLTSGDPLAG